MRSPLVIALASLVVGAGILAGEQGGAARADAQAAIPQRILFSSGDAVHEVDLSGRQRRVVIDGHFRERLSGIAPLPDGSLVLGVEQELIRYDAEGRQTADLGPGAAPVSSPDGTQIAFGLFAEPSASQLWVMNADGSGRRQLTTAAGFDTRPSWSPDGSTILYTHYGTDVATADTPASWLETVPATGGAPQRLTSSALDLAGRYSPDGQWIAFDSQRDRVPDDCGTRQCYANYLYVMRPDGSDAHRITLDPLWDAPFFATATTIVYGRHSYGTDELYRIEVDGTCRARITRDVLLDEAAAVAPGNVPPASGCLPATPVAELPPGPNFDAGESTISIAQAAKRRGMALYWLGTDMPPFALNTITIDDPSRHSLREPVHLTYACLAPGDDCTRRVFLTLAPACSHRLIGSFRSHRHVRSFRAASRIRERRVDVLLTGTTVVTVSADLPQDRDRAERQLRSLNGTRGRTGPGRPLPPPDPGVLSGRACPRTP